MVNFFPSRTCVFFVFLQGILWGGAAWGDSFLQPQVEMEWSGKAFGVAGSSKSWQVTSVSLSGPAGDVRGGRILRVQGMVLGQGNSGGKVLCEDQSVDVSAGGEFVVEVPYEQNPERVDLAWISKAGEVSQFSLSYHPKPMAIETIGPLAANEPQRRSRLLIGTGVTSLWYNQDIFRLNDYQSMVWTIKGSYHYALVPQKWELGASGFMNLFTVAENLDAQIRFYGANLRLGYGFGPIWKDWAFTLYGGWNYSSMSAKSRSFGFRNIMGPQIFPMFRKTNTDGSSAAFYLKFAPISSGLGILGLGNHEHAIGLSYAFQKWGQNLNLSLDYARLMLTFAQKFIDSRSLSFGVGVVY